MSLLTANEEATQKKIAKESFQNLWKARRSWANAYAKPVIESVLNEAFLKTVVGEIPGACYGDVDEGTMHNLNDKPKGAITSLTHIARAMVGRTVYVNPGVSANFQFMVGITGYMSESEIEKYSTGVGYEPFSLAFCGSSYYTTSYGGNSSRSSSYHHCVGLPGPDDDPTKWFAERITKYFEYWLKNCTDTPETHSNQSNRHYTERLYFLWPEDL